MYRILNVLIVLAVASALACAPASRRQQQGGTKPGVSPTKDSQGSQSPQGSPAPSDQSGSNDGSNGSGSVTPSSSTPGADGSKDPAAAAKPGVPNGGQRGSGSDDLAPPKGRKTYSHLGATSIVGVQIALVPKDDNLVVNLTFLNNPPTSTSQASIIIDKNGKMTTDDSKLITALGAYQCAEPNTAPLSCVNGAFTFTADKTSIEGRIQYAEKTDADGLIVTTVSPTYKPKSEEDLKGGDAKYRRIDLVLADDTMTGVSAAVRMHNATLTSVADDVEKTEDGNVSIYVWGLPTKYSYVPATKASHERINTEAPATGITPFTKSSHNLHYSIPLTTPNKSYVIVIHALDGAAQPPEKQPNQTPPASNGGSGSGSGSGQKPQAQQKQKQGALAKGASGSTGTPPSQPAQSGKSTGTGTPPAPPAQPGPGTNTAPPPAGPVNTGATTLVNATQKVPPPSTSTRLEDQVPKPLDATDSTLPPKAPPALEQAPPEEKSWYQNRNWPWNWDWKFW